MKTYPTRDEIHAAWSDGRISYVERCVLLGPGHDPTVSSSLMAAVNFMAVSDDIRLAKFATAFPEEVAAWQARMDGSLERRVRASGAEVQETPRVPEAREQSKHTPEGSVKSLKPGQKFEVKVDGRPYQTYIDEHGIQRFVREGLGGKLATLPFAGDLTQVCSEFLRGFGEGRYTMQDYQEFNMSLGFSVCGFEDCMDSLTLNDDIPDTDIENPVWNEK